MKDWARYAKWAVTAFVTVCAVLVFYDTFYHTGTLRTFLNKTIGVLAPVLYGAAMAYLLAPVVNWFERMLLRLLNKMGRIGNPPKKRVTVVFLRATGITLAWVTVLAFVYLLMSVLVPQLVESVKQLIANAEQYYNTAYGWVMGLVEDYPREAQWVLDRLDIYRDSSMSFIQSLLPRMEKLLESLTGGIWNGVWGVVTFAKNLVIGIILSVYLLATKEKSLARSCKAVYGILREGQARTVLGAVKQVDDIFSSFIRGKLMSSLVVGIVCFIGCSILKIPYTPLIAVVVGVTDVIPFFGPFLGAIPSAFLVLLVSPIKCLYFVLFILLLQQLEGNVISPQILGEVTGISSFWVIVSILVGGGFFGVLGMFLAVPTFATLQTLATYLVDKRLKKHGMPTDPEAYVGRYKLPPDTPPAAEETPAQETEPESKKE
ncbi:MAG: AI-2E family transporter [Oscillospiraceae bacterium]|nr:AI-2E family transporter [Oscillospiraceae bacterium]